MTPQTHDDAHLDRLVRLMRAGAETVQAGPSMPEGVRRAGARRRRRRSAAAGAAVVLASVAVAGALTLGPGRSDGRLSVATSPPAPTVSASSSATPTPRALLNGGRRATPGPHSLALAARLRPVWPGDGNESNTELPADDALDEPAGHPLRGKRSAGGAVVQWGSKRPVTGLSPALIFVSQIQLVDPLTPADLDRLGSGQKIVLTDSRPDGTELRIYAPYGAGMQRGVVYRPGTDRRDGIYFADFSASPTTAAKNQADLQTILTSALAS